MRLTFFLLILFTIYSCDNSSNEVYVDEFKWTLNIPKDFEDVPSKTRIETQKKGVEILEDTYPDKKVNIVARNLFHFSYGKYNSIQAQISHLKPDQTFTDKFNEANEIVIKSFASQSPNTKTDSNTSEKIIDGLEFKVFNLKTLNDSGENYEFTVYTRMFDQKQLEIIMVSNDQEKKNVFEEILNDSKFD